MGKNSRERKIQREKEREKKKRDEKIQRKINIAVSLMAAILCCWGYCERQDAMQVYDITICKVISKYKIHRHIGLEPVIEYYVSGVRYESKALGPSSCEVGDCFRIKYSVKKPKVYEVLWDEGKRQCPDCSESSDTTE